MAKTGTVRGDATVGDSGAPEVAVPLSLATATVTRQQSGKQVVAAGVTLTLSLSGSTPIQMLYLKIVTNSNKNPQSAVVTPSPGNAMPAVTEGLWINSTTAAVTSYAVAITTTDAEVEYIIAG